MRFVAAFFLMAAAPVCSQEITSATYSQPTARYAHGVLGDDEEWGRLEITVSPKVSPDNAKLSATYHITLPEELVFEDISPRLWDVTGDGNPEVVVVQSHADKGARLVVIGLSVDSKPVAIATTPFIGQRNRWLAPVAAADFDGDGHVEIGYVDRPHLAKTLRIWRWKNNTFRQITTLKGVSNHRIGDDFISGGQRDCGQGPEMVLASGDWQQVMVVRLTAKGISAMPVKRFDGAESFASALMCQ